MNPGQYDSTLSNPTPASQIREEQPFFSVIIPTYSRPKELAVCLESLVSLSYPRERFEVIVVDDGSEVSLESTTAPFQTQLHLSLITQQNSGPAKARNTGAFAAQGKFLAFTDDDCRPAANWLQALENRLTTAPTSLLGGRTINALPDNLYATASQSLIDYLYSYYNCHPEREHFFASNNMAVSAEQFRKLGGFNTSFPLAAGEDREFCSRWQHCGYPTLYAPEAEVFHAHALTLAKFWKQQFNYGRGAFCFQTISKKQTGKTALQQPLFYLKLLVYPFSCQSQYPALLLVLLFALSQVAVAAGLIKEKSVAAKDHSAANKL